MADVQTTQLRDALAWATNEAEPVHESSSNPFIWFWEAVEGDFNENRTTGQILVDAGISMIPLIDQICDVRDLIADCKKLGHNWKDHWVWVSLVLTLIGLFPTLGSLAKGVLKIFFAFVRREGGTAIAKSINGAMTWVVAFLRRREVQVFLKSKKVDEVFQGLATEFKSLRDKINVGSITAAFDRAINVLDNLASRVSAIPVIGAKAKNAVAQVKNVRLMADRHLAEALQPVHQIITQTIERLELEILVKQHGIVDAANIHYRGVIPEAHSIALMRKRKLSWLSNTGDPFHSSVSLNDYRKMVDKKSGKFDAAGNTKPLTEQFPYISDQSIKSFNTLSAKIIKGPTRLYRILSPNSRGMSECWVSKQTFDKLQSAPDPKAAWRRYLGVWPDWNANGQFVIYDIKAGETLNTWTGLAASQIKKGLDHHHLEGGWEQIVFISHTPMAVWTP